MTPGKGNLTEFGGGKIKNYRGGNPGTYLGNTLKWERGRQLKSIKAGRKSDKQSAEYTYAYDGSRLSKTVGKTLLNKGTKTEYILNGSMILQERITGSGEEEVLNYYYSPDGRLLEIGYRKDDEKEDHYSVIRNALGDVVALYTAEGTLVGTYEYDPYGKLISETKNPAYDDTDGILAKNPFRYRGYYYDRETGWYYLQSRYYDPEVKRFINADSTDLLTNDCDNMMQYNLFMYCNGNPVNGVDPSGRYSDTAVITGWIGTMWWLPLIDGPIPAGDIIFVGGVVVFGICAMPELLDSISQQVMESRHTKTGDYVEDWLNDESPTRERIGKQKGNAPRNNRRQNKQVTDALIAEGIRRSGDIKEKVHRAVSGAGNGFKELKDVVKEILKK